MISNVTIVMKYLRHKYMFPMTKSNCDAPIIICSQILFTIV
jgi:hypothetical protein